MDLGNFANWIMIVIIAIAISVMFAVLYFGSQHDAHTEIRSPESSRAVQKLIEQRSAAERKYGKPEANEHPEEKPHD